MFFTTNLTWPKHKALVDYIIEKWCVTLPELMKLKINWTHTSAISTFISRGRRTYAKSKWYDIVNFLLYDWDRYISTYYAQPIWKN